LPPKGHQPFFFLGAAPFTFLPVLLTALFAAWRALFLALYSTLPTLPLTEASI
jgi:hypothetical protein